MDRIFASVDRARGEDEGWVIWATGMNWMWAGEDLMLGLSEMAEWAKSSGLHEVEARA